MLPSERPQVKVEFDLNQSLLVNCYERALEKVDFLSKISHVTQLLQQGDVQLEHNLGPKMVHFLYELQKAKWVWINCKDSGPPTKQTNEKSTRQDEISQGKRLTNKISNWVEGIPFILNLTEQKTDNCMQLTVESFIPALELEVNETTISGMVSTNFMKKSKRVTTTEKTQERKDIQNVKNVNQLKIPAQSYHHCCQENNWEEEVREKSVDIQPTTPEPINEVYRKLLTKVEYSSEASPSSDIITNVANLRSIYQQIFSQLMHKKSMGLKFLQFSQDCSKELIEFQQYAIHFKKLLQHRLHLQSDSHETNQLRRCWKLEKNSEIVIDKLKEGQIQAERKWIQRMGHLELDLNSGQMKLERSRTESREKVTRIILSEFLACSEQRLLLELELDTAATKTLRVNKEMNGRQKHYLAHEHNARSEISNLERELFALLNSYDKTMYEKQEELDTLEKKVKDNVEKLVYLEKSFTDTEEKFEEMKISKRLKELLRNMEMAENFKRNRAATIIQVAWKRYYLRKLKRMKRKAKMKRKPRIPGLSKR